MTAITSGSVVRCPICRGSLASHEPYPHLLVCRTCGREFRRSQIASERRADDAPPASPPEPSTAKVPRTYKPKTCSCGDTFTPTGPRDIRCTPCKARF
jgi:DNA-directed RNA polymerase subunit RPC12/RpoP